MYRLLILFPKTADTKEVDAYVEDVVFPAHRASLGCQSTVVNTDPILSPQGPPEYQRIVVATFDSLEAIMEVGGSDIVKNTPLPLGTTILFFEVPD